MATGIPTFEQFKKLLRGTPMEAEAGGIYNAALAGKINPAFVAGLAMAESSGGKAGYAVGTHNPYGLGVHLGWRFPNYAKATSRLAQTLQGSEYRKLYKQSGARGVIGRYTPWGDASNNPNTHTSNIEKYGSSTGGNASIIYLDGTAAGAAPVAVPSVGGASQPPMPSQGRSSNLSAALALAPYIMGGNPNNPLLAAAIQSVGGGVSGGPTRSIASTGGATQNGAVNLNYGSVNGVVRPLPTPVGGGGDYGYADPEGQSGRHLAKDWFAKGGTPLASPVSGTVFRVKNDPNPGQTASGQVFGGSVYIKGTDGKVWVFRHVETPEKYTQAGRRVNAGQRIGAVKPWGGSSHAHIELYSPGPYEYSSARALNPYEFFTKAGIK